MNIGERVGDYEVIAVLGAGGMGEVYKVRNVLSDRVEAMKVLLPNLESNAELASRFLREIKVQAALDHPNIAKLYTAMTAGNRLLMMMELVEGESLEAMAVRQAITVPDAMRYAEQVLAALAYAHPRGVIHRDIKPSNIMVTASGVVKLLDFGIAKLVTDQRLTQTGRTIGSLYYMSPEQIRGGEPDPRSDLYALGVTLYELVTRRRPFAGDSDYSIMSAHLQQTPPAPVEIVPGVPPLLSDVIVMALAREPQARFQSADAMRAALLRAMGETPPPLPAEAVTRTATQPAANAPIVSPPVSHAPAENTPPPQASRRALYMTVGSLATLAILGAAVIEIPKFLGTHAAAEPAQQTASAPAPASTSAAAQAPAPDAAPAAPAPAPAAAPAPSKPRAAEPAKTPRKSSTPIAPDAAPTPAVVSAPAPAPVAAAPAPAPQSSELDHIRDQHDELAIRAASAREGLRSIRQQMASQGLGLRADVREAEVRMNSEMRKAMEAIDARDLDAARTHLTYAQSAIETIEKFLGH